MKSSGKNHISILTRFFSFLIASFLILFSFNSKANAQVFQCTWEDGVNECHVDNSDREQCDNSPSYEPIPSVCTDLSGPGNRDACLRKINNACRETFQGSYYQCGMDFKCFPCTPDPDNPLCSWKDNPVGCGNFCAGTEPPNTNHLCTEGVGCNDSSTCNPTTNPLCYDNAIACTTNCPVTDPKALGPNQYVCGTQPHTCLDSCANGYKSNCQPPAPASCTTPQIPQTCIDATGVGTTGRNPVQKCSNNGNEGIETALGCIPFEYEAFIPSLLGFMAGIIGAIALVVMLIGAITIMTAAGNPEAVKKGKELFTAAITGLLFIIFSVALLRIVAGDIIKLPGFTSSQTGGGGGSPTQKLY